MIARTPDPVSFNTLDSYLATSFSYAATVCDIVWSVGEIQDEASQRRGEGRGDVQSSVFGFLFFESSSPTGRGRLPRFLCVHNVLVRRWILYWSIDKVPTKRSSKAFF